MTLTTLTVSHHHAMQPGDFLDTSELGLCKIVASTSTAVTVRQVSLIERSWLWLRAALRNISGQLRLLGWRLRDWIGA